jgi:hypothetical protein
LFSTNNGIGLQLEMPRQLVVWLGEPKPRSRTEPTTTFRNNSMHLWVFGAPFSGRSSRN